MKFNFIAKGYSFLKRKIASKRRAVFFIAKKFFIIVYYLLRHPKKFYLALSSKAKKWTLRGAFFLLVIIVAIPLSLLFFNKEVDAAWWNDTWGYRKAITVANSSGSNQINYQVKILSNVDLTSDISNGKIQPSLNDLRFTDISGKPIKYWIEDSTNSSVDIWGYLSSVPAAGATIYMYYGNPGVGPGKSMVGTSDAPGLTCKAVKLSGQSTNNLYYIDPNGGNTTDKYQAHCDLNIDGGGWTVLIEAPAKNTNYNPFTDFGTVVNAGAGDYSMWSKSSTIAYSETLLKPSYEPLMWATMSTSGFFKWTDNAGTQFSRQAQYGYGFGIANTNGHSTGCAGWEGTGAYGMAFLEAPVTWCSPNGNEVGFGMFSGDPRGCHRDGMKWSWGTTPGGNGICPDPTQWKAGYVLAGVRESSISVSSSVISLSAPSSEEKGPGPVAYWKFDEGTGTTANDSVFQSIDATGGTVQDIGGYRVHTFTSPGTFTVNRSGNGNSSVEVLIVAGGGGGGSSQAGSGGGGGGGAGGLIYNSAVPMVQGQSETVAIGNGGAPGATGANQSGSNGEDSVFGSIVATGGGGGAKTGVNGNLGGSGGGGGYNGYVTVQNGGSGVSGQGNSGGNTSLLSWAGGAGGGGAGGIGGDNKISHAGGDRGPGLSYLISGSAVTYAVGGGGGANGPIASPANVGKGGDAAYAAGTAYGGGSGVVIVRYPVGNNAMLTNMSVSTSPTSGWQSEDKCVSGKCLAFDGTDDSVKIASSSSVNVSGDITVSAWIKPKTPETMGNIIHKDMQYSLVMNANKTVSWADSSNWSYASFGFQNIGIQSGQWNYITVTKTGGVVKIYLNGVEKVSKSFGGAITTTASVPFIGCYATASACSSQYFAGSIDEPKIYAYARTSAQIKTDYNAGLSGMGTGEGVAASFGDKSKKWMSDGLVGYWKMDEAASPSVDSSGNGNNGIWSAALASTGKFGKGIDIQGSGGAGVGPVVTINDSDSLDVGYTNSMTAAFWLKNDSSVCTAIMKKMSMWEIFRCSDALTVRFDGAAPSDYSSPTALANGQWYHVVLTRNYQTGKTVLYLNGKKDTEWTFAVAAPTTNGGLGVGAYVGGNWSMDGQFDETRLYNRELSNQEVSDLYNFAPGPNALWDFDNDTTSTIKDRSGNGLDLTVSGTAPTFVPGQFGKALNFNGGTETLTSAATSLLDTDYHTIGFWLRFNQLPPPGFGKIFTNASGGGTDRSPGIWAVSSANCLHWRYDPGNSGPTSCGGPNGESTYFTMGKWYYVTGIKNGGTFNFFVNGVQVESGAVSNPKTNGSSAILLGATGPYTSPYVSIDDMRIYNYARNSKQILEDMGAGDPASKSPIGYWKFDEGSGTVANNAGLLGSIRNGTLSSMSSPATTTSGWTNSGKFNRALNFDGVDDYVSMGIGSDYFPMNNFSICSWIKTPGLASGMSLNGIVSLTYGLTMFLDGSGKLNTRMDDGVGGPVVAADGDLHDNNWHQTCLTYDGTSRHLYVDGSKKNSTATTWLGTTRWPSDGVNVGHENNNYQIYKFNGQIDEVKIYNFALSSDDIASDFNQGKSVTMASAGISAGGGDNSAKAEYCIPGDASTCNAPIANWNFDEKTGTTVKDDSGNGYNGTVYNTTWTQGRTGSALSFNAAVGTYVSAPTINIPTDITAEAWVNSSNLNQNGFVVSKNAVNTQWELFFEGTNLVWRSQADVTNQLTYPAPSANKWHHIVATQSGAVAKMYVDGALVASTNSNTAIGNGAGAIEIGAFGSGTGYSFNGKIDGVRIYNYARTPAQVAYDFNRGGPVGWWKMDECQGGTIFDASGNENNGTWSGAGGAQTSVGTCTTSGTAWGNGAQGKFNSSLNFDTADDVVMVPSAVALNDPGAISVSIWVKSGDVTQDQTIVSRNGPFFLRISGSRFRVGIWSNSTWLFQNGTIPLANNTWTHLTLTYDGANVKAYVNGVLDFSTAKTGNMTSFNNLYFGFTPVGGENYALNGQIDDVRIYNYALTKEQIANVMNEGSALRFGPSVGMP